MTSPETTSHVIDKWVDPFACLNLPSSDQAETLHGEKRILSEKHNSRPVIVLTEAGRNIICAHIEGSLPQTSLSPDLIAALSVNSVVNPPTNLNNWGFHFLNILWNFRGIALRRSDLTNIKSALARSFMNHPHPEWFPRRSDDDDIIQHVNKTSQWGLVHNSEYLKTPNGDAVNYYWLYQPLEFTTPRDSDTPQDFKTQIPTCECKTVPTTVNSSNERDLALERLRVIQYLIDNFLNVPLSGWTLEGHRDAQNKERGTIAQPKKFNRAARDRWKFDENGLTLCPSSGNLAANLRNFYPSDSELFDLYSAIKQELGMTTLSDQSDS